MNPTSDVPDTFECIERGLARMFLRKDYKDILLDAGIEDPQAMVRANGDSVRKYKGRAPIMGITLNDGTKVVVKRYFHGGIARAITRDIFHFWPRFPREIRLVEKARSAKLNTLEIVAMVRHHWWWFLFKADVVTLEIPGSKDFVELFSIESDLSPKLKREAIERAGREVRRFHDAGFYHADLNLKNLLFYEEDMRVFVIDLDKSVFRGKVSRESRLRNIGRLDRSVEKLIAGKKVVVSRADRMRFLKAYFENDDAFDKAKLVRHLFKYRTLHRIKWLIGS